MAMGTKMLDESCAVGEAIVADNVVLMAVRVALEVVATLVGNGATEGSPDVSRVVRAD